MHNIVQRSLGVLVGRKFQADFAVVVSRFFKVEDQCRRFRRAGWRACCGNHRRGPDPRDL